MGHPSLDLTGKVAVVVGGTTGESPTLERAELEALVRRAKVRLAGRIPVIAGSGTNSTASSIALSRAAEAAGEEPEQPRYPSTDAELEEWIEVH